MLLRNGSLHIRCIIIRIIRTTLIQCSYVLRFCFFAESILYSFLKGQYLDPLLKSFRPDDGLYIIYKKVFTLMELDISFNSAKLLVVKLS